MQIDGIAAKPDCADGIWIVHRHRAGGRLIITCIVGAVGGRDGNVCRTGANRGNNTVRNSCNLLIATRPVDALVGSVVGRCNRCCQSLHASHGEGDRRLVEGYARD